MKTETVALIGLERISGSIGLALRGTDLGLTLVGFDRDREAVQSAQQMGIIDKSESSLRTIAGTADIIIMNIPLSEREKVFQTIGPEVQEHTLIVDLSNLKGEGLKAAEKHLATGHYVGVGPVLAADTLTDGRFGIDAARADLFQKSVFCIMPAAKADPQAVETAVNLGRILGAAPFFLDAWEYDSLMQGVDTAPGLLAAAMFRAIADSTGWRDMLRFADLRFAQSTAAIVNPDLARMALADKASSLRWLDAVLAQLQEVRRWVDEADEERLTLILEELDLERDRWLIERRRNDWDEFDSPDLSGMSLRSQLFGFRPKSKDKKK